MGCAHFIAGSTITDAAGGWQAMSRGGYAVRSSTFAVSASDASAAAGSVESFVP